MSQDDSVDGPTMAERGVLVVGGTSGVGLAAARAFVDAGVRHIVLVGRNVDRGRTVCDEMRAAGRSEVDFVAADVRDEATAIRVATDAYNHLGRIDVLVNATSASHVPTLFHTMPFDDIRGIITDVILPPLLMSRAVLPVMGSQSFGCILNIASDAAKVPTPGETVIGAAMAAIVTFSQTLATEAKRDGIRVNVLTPSLIDGTGTADRLFADEFSSRLFGKARSRADLGVTTPEDQAALIVFLAGPGGQRITGQAISVNGGISTV